MINVNFKFLNVVCKVNRFIILSFIVVFYSCNKEGLIIDNGEGITIEFLEGLNDNPQYQLTKDSNGYYEMGLEGLLPLIKAKGLRWITLPMTN